MQTIMETDTECVLLILKIIHISVYLLGSYGISTFEGYLMPNPFLYK